MDPWEDAVNDNGTIGNSINRTLPFDLDNVAVSDFAGSRGTERVR